MLVAVSEREREEERRSQLQLERRPLAARHVVLPPEVLPDAPPPHLARLGEARPKIAQRAVLVRLAVERRDGGEVGGRELDEVCAAVEGQLRALCARETDKGEREDAPRLALSRCGFELLGTTLKPRWTPHDRRIVPSGLPYLAARSWMRGSRRIGESYWPTAVFREAGVQEGLEREKGRGKRRTHGSRR